VYGSGERSGLHATNECSRGQWQWSWQWSSPQSRILAEAQGSIAVQLCGKGVQLFADTQDTQCSFGLEYRAVLPKDGQAKAQTDQQEVNPQ